MLLPCVNEIGLSEEVSAFQDNEPWKLLNDRQFILN